MGPGNHDSSPFRCFCGKPRLRAFAQQQRHLTQPSCQLIKAAPCPTDGGFPCLPRGACCSCCARSAASSPARARSAGVRVEIDSRAGPAGTAGRSLLRLAPYCPLTGRVLLVLQFQNASWVLQCQTFQLSSERKTKSASTGFFLMTQGK